MTELITELEAGPTGRQVGAFFDLDGTLVDGFTPAAHARHRIRNREARIGELLGVAEAALRYRYGRMEFERLLVRAAGYLRGAALDELDELGEELFRSQIRQRMRADMTQIVRTHLVLGHTVVLSSSAMSIHAGPVARALDIPHLICNRFELDGDGRLTGGVVAPIIWGPRKADAASAFSADRGVDLSRSYFYSDGDEDLPLMHAVGNPRPVNPRPGMAATAAEQGWPVLRFAGARKRGWRIGLNTLRG